MKIFHNSLVRECAGTAIATFVVLLGITVTTQLVRFLGLAAGEGRLVPTHGNREMWETNLIEIGRASCRERVSLNV